ADDRDGRGRLRADRDRHDPQSFLRLADRPFARPGGCRRSVSLRRRRPARLGGLTMAGPEALTIQSNGLNLRVWRWIADGPPLLVVHGITNSARGWDFVCRDLQRDLEVYAVDLRGHGESDKPEHGYRTSDYAADL